MHIINHSDQEFVIPKRSFVGAMEKVHVSDQDTNLADTPREPVNQYTLSECLCQSDFVPIQRLQLYNVLQQHSGVFRSSIDDLTSTHHFKHYIDTGDSKLVKERAYRASHHHRKKIEKHVKDIIQNGIIELSASLWASLVDLVKKTDETLRLWIAYRDLNKITIKDSYPLPHIQDTLDVL